MVKNIIAILIPVHNGIAYTKKCLDNLQRILPRETDSLDYRIIVIDDGSVDSTARWIHENHPETIVLQGDGNLWWSGAINMGAKYAMDTLNASHILLWNNDIVIGEDYFTVLAGIIFQEEKDVLIGSKIYCDPEFQKVWSAGGVFDTRTGAVYMMGYFAEDQAAWQEVLEVDWLTGMGTLIPKEVIEKTGYWDAKRFPQYFGDTDFTLRAKNKGFKNKVVPRLKIANDTSNSGIKKIYKWSDMKMALTSVKSLHHIGINYQFYRQHARTFRAFSEFFRIYYYFFGGFLKRKIKKFFRINDRS